MQEQSLGPHFVQDSFAWEGLQVAAQGWLGRLCLQVDNAGGKVQSRPAGGVLCSVEAGGKFTHSPGGGHFPAVAAAEQLPWRGEQRPDRGWRLCGPEE